MWSVIKICCAGVLVFAAVSTFACGIGLFTGVARDGAAVMKAELYPTALLRKYEWFKDASAALDKKQADIGVYDSRLSALNAQYTGVKRSSWARDDREQSSVWQSELAGVKASYNQLAAEYNSEMSKLNWRFTNTGDVPQGGRPLPRDYRPYQEQ